MLERREWPRLIAPASLHTLLLRRWRRADGGDGRRGEHKTPATLPARERGRCGIRQASPPGSE